MGVLVIGLNVITNVWIAAPFLILLGAIGGYLVVPMNALLQHRGANLMGAGRSIAVQNFNEQACILGLGAFYTGMTRFGLSAFTSIGVFGVLVAGDDVADPRAGTAATACTTAARSSTCSRSPAATSIDGRRRRAHARAWPRWRWSSTPSSGAPRGGRCASCRRRACIRSGPRRSSSRSPRSSIAALRPRAFGQVLRTPALWLLVAAAGTDQRRLQLGAS